MGVFRRAPIALLACLLAGCVGQTQTGSAGPAVRVENGPKPGSFRIVNPGTDSVSLDSRVIVEHLVNGEWKAIPVIVELFEKCSQKPLKACPAVGGGQTLQPVAWTGSGCGSQCDEPCRGNIYYGPGKFRFVVRDCAKQRRFTGPEFELPANPGG